MLRDWRQHVAGKTERLDPVPRYADVFALMEYEVQESRVPDQVLDRWLEARGTDVVMAHSPVIYAFRSAGVIPGPRKPYITILETDAERDAFFERFDRLAEIEDPNARPRVITPGPLMRWDVIPTLFVDELPYVARYAPMSGDATWPDLWITTVTPEEIDPKDRPYRDRYRFRFEGFT